MDRRPWWERLFDRDNEAAPIILLIVFVLAIGFVLVIGPVLDRIIAGERPASHAPAGVTTSLTRLAGDRQQRSRPGRTQAGSAGRRHRRR
jgi:hypothetical protein